MDSPVGWWNRWTKAYRAQYAKLPPGVQLVGLQLWLPLVFIVMFCFCYLAAFKSPSMHEAPVAIVAEQQVVEGFEQATGDTIAYSRFDDVAEAREQLADGDVIAVFDASAAPDATLYVASAHQFQASSIAQQALQPVAAGLDLDLTVTDIAPLPAHDSFGMVPMYLMLTFCIGGYMVAMFIGMMGAPLLHRTRIAIIAGGAVVVSLLANTLAGPILGAVEGHFWSLFLGAAGWIFAIGLTVNGLSYFFGRFITLPAILIFVFLSIPSSGAAYPVWMLPAVFGHLQHFVVGYGMTEMIKQILYGVGEPLTTSLLQMGAYALVGVILTVIGKPWRARRDARRILRHETTMMSDAQTANREHHMEIRERILAKYGVSHDEVRHDADDTSTNSIDTVTGGGQAIASFDDEKNTPRGA